LTLKLGTSEINYPAQNTDASGYFTVSVANLALGNYNWRVKGPKYLANAGAVTLTGAPTIPVEMGLMRVGDCNNDNTVSIVDFSIVKNSFGRAVGEQGYDDRADLNGDQVITVVDASLLRSNFGFGGAPPLHP